MAEQPQEGLWIFPIALRGVPAMPKAKQLTISHKYRPGCLAEIVNWDLSLFEQSQSATRLVDHLTLGWIQIHKFKSVAVPRLTAYNSSNPYRATHNRY